MELISNVLESAKLEIEKIKTSDELALFYQNYLGKTGKVTDLMKNMKDLPNDQKKTFGM